MRPEFAGGIWLADFEFHARDCVEGNPLHAVCMVAEELATGVVHRVWRDDLVGMRQAPFPTDETALVVAYSASAEMACFQSLGWAPPHNVLDLYAEFRNLTNGFPLPAGRGLLGALAYFGQPCAGAARKEAMRDLVLGGGPWSAEERQAILDYCESDVTALKRLFLRMDGADARDPIDWPRALHRGRYCAAAAAIEHRGIPVDTEVLALLDKRGPALRLQLTEIVDRDYGVFERGHFRAGLFAQYLDRQDIPWPTTATGRLELSDDTFREMARAYPQLGPLQQLRQSLALLRNLRLTVGGDGRNRYPLFPFSSVTGRNQPSTSEAIFGHPAWMRGVIRPASGRALAYVDFSQQELAVAAALSGDEAMMAALRTSDFYMAFAIRAGGAPAGATKASHPAVREKYKQCALAVLYGMGEHGLALRLGISVIEARGLLDTHRRAYAAFWRWSDAMVDNALLTGKMRTVFGWTLNVDRDPNVRLLRNFPMQANGAEMLRLACVELVERGVNVCAPVHDAVLIEAPIDEIDAALATTQAIMREASSIVLGGFEVAAEAKIVRHPERFLEPKGIPMWNRVMTLLGRPDAIVELNVA